MMFSKWVKIQMFQLLSIILVVSTVVSSTAWSQVFTLPDPQSIKAVNQHRAKQEKVYNENKRAIDLYHQMEAYTRKTRVKNQKRENDQKLKAMGQNLKETLRDLELDQEKEGWEKEQKKFEYYYERELARTGVVLKRAAGDSIGFAIAGYGVDWLRNDLMGPNVYKMMNSDFMNTGTVMPKLLDWVKAGSPFDLAQFLLNPRFLETNIEALTSFHGFAHFFAFIYGSDYYSMWKINGLRKFADGSMLKGALNSHYMGMVVGSVFASVVTEYGFGIGNCTIEKWGRATDYLKMHGKEITVKTATAKTLDEQCNRLWKKFKSGRSGATILSSLLGLVPAAIGSHYAGGFVRKHMWTPLKLRSKNQLTKVVDSKVLSPVMNKLKAHGTLSLPEIMLLAEGSSAIKKPFIVGYHLSKAGTSALKHSIWGRIFNGLIVRPILAAPGFGMFLMMDSIFRPMLAEPVQKRIEYQFLRKQERDLQLLTKLGTEYNWSFSKQNLKINKGRIPVPFYTRFTEPYDTYKRYQAHKNEENMESLFISELEDYIYVNQDYRNTRLANLHMGHDSWSKYLKRMTQRFGTSLMFYSDFIGMGKNDSKEAFETKFRHAPLGISHKYKVVPGVINPFDAVWPMRVKAPGHLVPFDGYMTDYKKVGLEYLDHVFQVDENYKYSEPLSPVQLKHKTAQQLAAEKKKARQEAEAKENAEALRAELEASGEELPEYTDIDESSIEEMPKLKLTQLMRLDAAETPEKLKEVFNQLKLTDPQYEKIRISKAYSEAKKENFQLQLKQNINVSKPKKVCYLPLTHEPNYVLRDPYTNPAKLIEVPCNQFVKQMWSSPLAQKYLKGIDIEKYSVADLGRILAIKHVGHMANKRLASLDLIFNGTKVHKRGGLRGFVGVIKGIRTLFLSNKRKDWEQGVRLLYYYAEGEGNRCTGNYVPSEDANSIKDQGYFIENYIMNNSDESLYCMPNMLYAKLGYPEVIPFGALFLQKYDNDIFKVDGIIGVNKKKVHGFEVRNLAEDYLVHMACGPSLERPIGNDGKMLSLRGEEYLSDSILWGRDMTFNPPKITSVGTEFCKKGGDPMNGSFTVQVKLPVKDKVGESILVKKTYTNLLDLVSENIADSPDAGYQKMSPIICHNFADRHAAPNPGDIKDPTVLSKAHENIYGKGYGNYNVKSPANGGHPSCGYGDFTNSVGDFWTYYVEGAYKEKLKLAKKHYTEILKLYGKDEFDPSKMLTREQFSKITKTDLDSIELIKDAATGTVVQVKMVEMAAKYFSDINKNFTVLSSYKNQWKVFLDQVIEPIYLDSLRRQVLNELIEYYKSKAQFVEQSLANKKALGYPGYDVNKAGSLAEAANYIDSVKESLDFEKLENLPAMYAKQLHFKRYLKRLEKVKTKSLDDLLTLIHEIKDELTKKKMRDSALTPRQKFAELDEKEYEYLYNQRDMLVSAKKDYVTWTKYTQNALMKLFDFTSTRNDEEIQEDNNHLMALVSEIRLAYGLEGLEANERVQNLARQKREIENNPNHKLASRYAKISRDLLNVQQAAMQGKANTMNSMKEKGRDMMELDKVSAGATELQRAVVEKITNTMMTDLMQVNVYRGYFTDILHTK